MRDETPETEVERTSDEAGGSEFEVLAREIDENPGGPSFPRLAEAYRRAGQVDRAESIAKQGLSQSPERMSGRVALALAMLDKGETTQAMQELASIMENVPDLPSGSPEPVAAEAVESTRGEHRLYSEPLAAPSAALPNFDDRGDRSSDEFHSERHHEQHHEQHHEPNHEPRSNEQHHLLDSEEEPERHDASSEALRQAEIDDAIDSAHAEEDQMVSANQLAEAALREIPDTEETFSPGDHPVFTTETMAGLLEGQGDRDGAERIRASIPSLNVDTPLETDTRSTTAPEIVKPAAVASLSEVESISGGPMHRDTATLPAVPDLDPEVARKSRIIHRLESWIANIRREVA